MSTATKGLGAKPKTKDKSSSRSGSPGLFWIAAGGLMSLFAIAIAMTASNDRSTSTPGADLEQYRPVAIQGEALAMFPEDGADPAIGARAPSFEGETFDGRSVSVGVDGRPKVVMLLAHWCPHCQADVKSIQSWIDADGAPKGVDLYAVSTWAEPANPNFPPSEWLEREGWTTTTVADDKNSTIATDFGPRGTPMYVFIDDQGIVRWRYSGELPIEGLEKAIADLR